MVQMARTAANGVKFLLLVVWVCNQVSSIVSQPPTATHATHPPPSAGTTLVARQLQHLDHPRCSRCITSRAQHKGHQVADVCPWGRAQLGTGLWTERSNVRSLVRQSL